MIYITDVLAIGDNEIDEEFIHASGPGGQNVNKVATAVQLRFNVYKSPSLPDDIRTRLISIAGKRVSGDGVLIIKAGRYRTRERNRHDALERLISLIRNASEVPKSRRKTKPTLASKKRRIETKRKLADRKRTRRSVKHTEE
jgi:ribosome-associated protein